MAQFTRQDDRGFAMVALLIAMAIAAIWATAVLPKWRTQVQRGREEDLIFRGEQYARAIMLYQDKNRNLPPPSIDVLISQHYLRKKWKDPVTNDEFALVGIGLVSQTSTSPTSPAGAAGGGTSFTPQGRAGAPGGGAAPINTGGNQSPGITGVRSKSMATSIKIYQQQQQYNLWQFDAATYRQSIGRQIPQQPGGGRQGQPGQGAPGQGGPGGARGGPGGGVGGGRGGEAGSPVRPGTPPPAPVGGRGRGGN
jgi:type II secretory pathway pseudopilin PulG